MFWYNITTQCLGVLSFSPRCAIMPKRLPLYLTGWKGTGVLGEERENSFLLLLITSGTSQMCVLLQGVLLQGDRWVWGGC